MGIRWRGLAGASLVAGCALQGAVGPKSDVHAATTQAPQALAYVTNGQVTVFEAGSVTTVGPGQNPVWSPNGTNLLYIAPDFVTNIADLYLADTHGANTHRVLARVYPYIAPGWSPDSKSIVYAAVPAGEPVTGATIRLEVRALNVSARSARLLGTVTIRGGCSQTGTALQTAIGKAEGTFRDTPSTLLWAQPGLVAVQASCSGSGLILFKPGGKQSTLADWSAGVLAPNGRTIAASVLAPGAKRGSAQLGLIDVATGRTRTVRPEVPANAVTWTSDSKAIVAVAQPTDTLGGVAQIERVTADGKTATRLGQIHAAGAFHPSLARGNASLALAVVTSTLPNAAAQPATFINLISATATGVARPFFLGAQPAWRP